MKDIKVSEHINRLKINDDYYVIWNRYSPSLLKVNDEAIDFIDDVQKRGGAKLEENNKAIVELLLKYNILFKGDLDLFKDEFKRSIHARFGDIKENAECFYRHKRDYRKLTIVNDICNLKCPYCVNQYKNPYPPVRATGRRKGSLVDKVVDQFMAGKVKNNVSKVQISFNGGEILLNFGSLERVVRQISRKYSHMEVEYSLNTNMTPMTEEIAEFLGKYNFEVYISIDGYREAHNKTRQYHSGNGSFDDILKGLEIFRKYNERFPIKGFQGTIENVDNFDIQEVYKMEKFGFTTARLAPNLLTISEEDALKKANLMGRFLDFNLKNNLKITDTYFDNINKLINLDKYFFFFNCRGLEAYPELELFFNLSTLRVSHLCSFIPAATCSFEEMECDIYNPKLWKVSGDFIQKRIQSIFSYCIDCWLVGICRGGCIYAGLDKENKLNRAACVYLKELFKIYIRKIYGSKESGV